ncbi:hypothetical protein [Streptomyces nitrosporeus]|uniref:hypothetical protein n=1 Tax=Streptomyces nitrosporeus TaxID=28894 RepID=UPI00332DB4D6
MSAKIVPPAEAAYNLMLIVAEPYPGIPGATQTTYIQEFLSKEPDDVELFVPKGWELLEDESEVIVRGDHNCDCCGLGVVGRRYCEGCPRDEWEPCDPAKSSHCFTGYCDGTECSFEGECESEHEVRVWNEVSNLLGLWEVKAEASGRVRVIQREGYERDAETVFDSLWSAWQYAQGCAEMHAQALRDDCECGEEDCGVMYPHGIRVQEVTTSRDLSRT